jgi:hypothetical protein
MDEGRLFPADRLVGGEALGRACDLGMRQACFELARFAKNSGDKVLDQACSGGDVVACYVIGGLYLNGQGIERNEVHAAALFEKSCDAGFLRGCGRLGQSYLTGRGKAKNPSMAAHYFDKACAAAEPFSCYDAAFLYLRGNGVAKSEYVAESRMQRACALGMRTACSLANPTLAEANPAKRR